MAKRIFKIIAIVLACATGVVGITVGVLALQGKFRTPVVYPASLSFSMEKTMIVDDYDDEVFSIVLNSQSNQEHAVNQRTCYIRFIRGEDLITLCDMDGNPIYSVGEDGEEPTLSEPTNGWHEVLCDSPIYFTLNDVDESDFNTEYNGQVTLVARDERNMVDTEEYTFTIDRKVNSIRLDADDSIIDSDASIPEQDLTLGLSNRQDLTFVTSPDYSLSPISGVDSKIVELYYLDPEVRNDLVRIDETSVEEYDFLHIDQDTNQMYFETTDAGVYEFRVAVFPTYEARVQYEADPENEGALNSSRVNKMISTILTINVVNSQVTGVDIIDSGIVLNLYEHNNYLLLNSTSSSADANYNNLNLTFSPSNNETAIRYNEVDFALTDSTAWRNNNIVFTSSSGATITFATNITVSGVYASDVVFDDYTINGNILTLTSYNTELDPTVVPTMTINFGDIIVRENANGSIIEKRVITSIDLTLNSGTTDAQFYSFNASNGLAFVRSVTNTQGGTDAGNVTTTDLTLLLTGTYLDFYIYNSDTFTRATDLDYEVIVSGTGKEKCFNVIIKNQLELIENTSLVLGALVVNSSGGEIMFDTTAVTIQTVALSYDYQDGSRAYDLNVTYQQSGGNYIAQYGELELNDLIRVNGGTYNTILMLTTEEYRGEVDTIAGLNFTDSEGTNYYVIGYFDANNVFVNNVRAREGAKNIGAKIYLVQLRNLYGESASDVVDRLFEDYAPNETEGDGTISIPLTDSVVVSTWISNEDAITINVNYELVKETLSFNYLEDGNDYLSYNQDGSVNIVEGMSGTLEISSPVPDMLSNIYNAVNNANPDAFRENNVAFYLFTGNNNYDTNTSVITITNVTLTGGTTENPPVEDGDENTGTDGDNTNLENAKLLVTFSANESSLSSGVYLCFVLKYGGEEIISTTRMYITDTESTDIYLNQTVQGSSGSTTQEYSLAQTAGEAETGSYPYLEVLISSYTEQDGYQYTLTIKDASGNAIFTSAESIFTQSVTGKTENGFVVAPAITGVNHNLSYSSTNEDIFSYDFESGTCLVCNLPNANENVALEISSGNIQRYLKVVIVVNDGENGFNFDIPEQNTQLDVSAPLSDYADYTYNGISIPLNAQYVGLSNVNRVSFGLALELTTIQDEADPNTIYLRTSNGDNVLTITNDAENGWTFTRDVNYLYTSLTIEFDLKVSTESSSRRVRLSFTSSITIDVNPLWTEIYAGTSVLLYEERSSSIESFQNQAYFNITNTTGDTNVIVNVTGDVNVNDTGTYTSYVFNDVGTYTIEFVYNGGVIASVPLEVLPNYIISEVETELESDTEYDLSEIISVQEYITTSTIIYGYSKDVSNNIIMYSSDYLESITDDELIEKLSNLVIEPTTNTSLLTQTGSTLKTGWIESLNDGDNEALVNVNIQYVDGRIGTNVYITLHEMTLTIRNKYAISGGLFGPLKTHTAVPNEISVDGFTLSSITTNKDLTLEFSNASNFVISTYLSNTIEDVIFTYTFVDGEGRELTYSTNPIIVNPYTPTLIDPSNIAYSNSSYDLIEDVFENVFNYSGGDPTLEVEAQIFAENVTSFVIQSVNNPGIITNYDEILGAGYSASSANYSAEALFNSFTGDTYTITITYRITYIDGTFYDYEYTLEIINRIDPVVQYPFMDNLLVNNVSFNFLNNEDANILGANNGVLTSTDSVQYYFEPVSLGQTINFETDENLGVERVNLIDKNPLSVVDCELDYDISLVAYQSNPAGLRYYSYIDVDNVNKEVYFDSSTTVIDNGASAYFIFKIVTTTGSYDYYIVYLYNQRGTNFVNVNKSTIIKQANVATDDNVLDETNNTLFGIEINSTLLAEFNISSTSIRLEDLDFYILDATDTAGKDCINLLYNQIDDDEQEAIRYALINDAKLKDVTNFTTFKVAVVYSGSSYVYLGNIDFVVATDILSIKAGGADITLDGEIEPYKAELVTEIDGIDNGNYNVTIPNNSSLITNPFEIMSGDYTLNATISSIYEDSRFYISEDNLSIYLAGTSTDPILSVDSSSGNVEIFKQVLNSSLEFSIRYEYRNNADNNQVIVANVTYSYSPISLNTDEISVSVGNFEANAFVDTYKLTDIFGNYRGEVEIYVGEEHTTYNYLGVLEESEDDYNYSANIGDSIVSFVMIDGEPYLKFNLTHVSQTVIIRLEFNDIAGINVVKTITANVGMGLYYSTNPYTSSVTAYRADKVIAEADGTIYDSRYGSTAKFEILDSDTTGSNYVTYNLGGANGFTIYIYDNAGTANTTKLELNFSDSNYVVNTAKTGEGNLSITDANSEIQFTHSASDKTDFIVNIEIQLNDQYFTTTNATGAHLSIPVYVLIPQTYSGIRAVYETKNSSYEVVQSNTSQDINMFNTADADTSVFNRHKLAIVPLSSVGVTNAELVYDYDPAVVGFNVEGNPNYLEYSRGENTTITENVISFDRVDTNTPASIYITNETMEAGTGAIAYEYMILPSDTSDRLTPNQELSSGITTTSSGDKNYIVALISDSDIETQYQTRIQFGSIADLSNLIYATSVGYYTVDSDGTSSSNTNYSGYTNNAGEEVIITIGGISVTITIGDSGELFFTLTRTRLGALFNVLYLDLTLYGNDLICENYRFMFYNYSLSPTNNENYSVNAGTQIVLEQVVRMNSNAGGSPLTMTDARLDYNNSYYMLDGERKTINSEINELFSYTTIDTTSTTTPSTTTHRVEFNPVADNVTSHIEFAVDSTIDGVTYTVGSVVFNWRILPNHQFVINGETINNASDNFDTNYILTMGNLDTKNVAGDDVEVFPYTTGIEYTNYAEPDRIYNYGDQSYYEYLNFSVQTMDHGLSVPLADADLEFIIVNADDFGYVTIDGVDLPAVEIVKDTNDVYRLIIRRDITADLQIEVTARFIHIGEYTRTWLLHVQGFADFDYIYTTSNTILPTQGENFISGSTVKPISTTGDTSSTGVTVGKPGLNNFTFDISVNYVDITNANVVEDVESLYNNAEEKIHLNRSNDDEVNSGEVEVVMPFVEQSATTSAVSHIVIMKVDITYFDYTVTRYIAYRVYNNIRVQQAENAEGASINVDNSDEHRINIELPDAANLNLLYFAEEYTHIATDGTGSGATQTTTTFTITRTDTTTDRKVYTLNVTGKTVYTESGLGIDDRDYSATITSANPSEFTGSVDGVNVTYSISKSSNGSATIVRRESSGTTTYEISAGNVSTISTNNTLYSSTFNNISEFNTFLNDIRYIQLSNVSGFNVTGFNGEEDNVYYQFTHLGDGVWGINLLAPFRNADFGSKITLDDENILFNGELVADINIVQTNSSIVIQAYSSTNTSGFRLYGNKRITPKGTTEYTLYDMFNTNEIDLDYSNYRVIGIVTVDANTGIGTSWVNLSTGGSIESSAELVDGAILKADYELYRITFTENGTTTDSIYNTQAVYYAVQIPADTSTVIRVNYTTSLSYFSVQYPETGNSVFAFKDRFYEFEMSGDILTRSDLTPTDVTQDEGNAINDTGDVTIGGTSITISRQALIKYKYENNASTFVDLTYRYNVGDRTINFVVRFWLPTTAYRVVNLDGTETEQYVETIDESPTRDGYTFEGWYTDKALENAWDGTLSNKLTLYAKWTAGATT